MRSALALAMMVGTVAAEDSVTGGDHADRAGKTATVGMFTSWAGYAPGERITLEGGYVSGARGNGAILVGFGAIEGSVRLVGRLDGAGGARASASCRHQSPDKTARHRCTALVSGTVVRSGARAEMADVSIDLPNALPTLGEILGTDAVEALPEVEIETVPIDPQGDQVRELSPLDFMVELPSLVGRRVRVPVEVKHVDFSGVRGDLRGGDVVMLPPWRNRADIARIIRECGDDPWMTDDPCRVTVEGVVTEDDGSTIYMVAPSGYMTDVRFIFDD